MMKIHKYKICIQRLYLNQRLLASWYPSVRLSACISAAQNIRSTLKFNIPNVYKNLLRKSKFG
jgi:hypothetical protein